MRRLLLTAVLAALALLVVAPATHADQGPIKVFILAGQSNMVGYGSTGKPSDDPEITNTLRYMVKNDQATFGHGGTNPLVDAEGNWLIRDDVMVYAHNDNSARGGEPVIKISGLTAGLGGWSASNRSRTGPEYGFGQVIGNTFDEDVLIIKVADGGTSLDIDWRSPTTVTKRGGEVGRMWTLLTSEVEQVLNNLSTHFPNYADRETEIVGFGWHQGWNDANPDRASRYEANLADLIRDVQSTYGEHLPFVIAESGMGSKQSDALTVIRNAQGAMADAKKYPEFKGEVTSVDTRDFFYLQPSKRFEFHWNNDGRSMYQIGEAMGKAYLELVGK